MADEAVIQRFTELAELAEAYVGGGWIFRGVSNRNYRLVPKIGRIGTREFGPGSMTMTTSDRVIVDPGIAHGRAVIRGTRVPVTLVLGNLAGGMSIEDVQHEYSLTREDVLAALRFAAQLTSESS